MWSYHAQETMACVTNFFVYLLEQALMGSLKMVSEKHHKMGKKYIILIKLHLKKSMQKLAVQDLILF